jgi:hypothetical protein
VLDVVREVLARELASHLAIAEAFDAAIAQAGVINRRGEPRSLIAHRLRVSTRISRLLDQMTALEAEACAAASATAADPQPVDTPDEEQPPEPLHAWIARVHFRDAIAEIAPEEFDPETFLRVVIDNDAAAITPADRRRARKLLTQREREQYEFCTCRATPAARDASEMRDWIDEFRKRDAGRDPTVEKVDALLAAEVRRLANGEELDAPAPYYYEQRKRAVADARSLLANAPDIQQANRAKRHQKTRSKDPAVRRFWRELLASDDAVPPKTRLDAFVELDELNVLPRCVCKPPRHMHLEEVLYDEHNARIIRLVAQNTRTAAEHIAAFANTALAVQDAADATILEHTYEIRKTTTTRPQPTLRAAGAEASAEAPD